MIVPFVPFSSPSTLPAQSPEQADAMARELAGMPRWARTAWVACHVAMFLFVASSIGIVAACLFHWPH